MKENAINKIAPNRISSNLLKCKQSSRKTSIVCCWLNYTDYMQDSHCVRHPMYDNPISNRRFHFLEFLNSITFISRKHILLLNVRRRTLDMMWIQL